MTVDVAPGGVSTSASVIHETLWSTDPRISPAIDHTGLTFSDTGLQAAATLANSGPAGTRELYCIPGLIKKQTEIDFAAGSAHPFVLRGAGDVGTNRTQSPTVIWDAADAGAGKFSIKNTGSASFVLRDIAFQGSQNPPAQPGGTFGYLMRGLLANTACTFERVSANGYAAGLGLNGDHMNFIDCNFQGNDFGIEFLPLTPTQGDIHFLVATRAGGCSKAAIAVASSSKMAGVQMVNFEASTSPYCIARYQDGQAADVTDNWIIGLEVDNMATEFTGNGVVYDGVGNAAGIQQIKFDHGEVNLGLGNGLIWQGATDRGLGATIKAAWYNSGTISDVEFKWAFPSATNTNKGDTTTAPAILAPAITRVVCKEGAGADLLGAAGLFVFALLGNVNGSNILESAMGEKRASRTCVFPRKVSRTAPSVLRGQLVTNYSGATAEVGPYIAGTLSSPLNPGGGNISSLPVNSWPAAIPLPSVGNATVTVIALGQSQQWTVSGAVLATATSLPVSNQTPNFAFPSGSRVVVGSGKVSGIASHDEAPSTGSQANVLHVTESCKSTNALNTSGVTIAPGATVIPHGASGIQAGSHTDGQVVGIALASIASGALGLIEALI